MVRRLCLGVVVVVLLAPWLAFADSPAATSLVLDPFAPNTLYASTPERGVFKSPDGGATWTATGLTNTPVFALAIDPGVPSLLYAVTPSGLLTSVDGGDSWTATGLMNYSSITYWFQYDPVLTTVGSVSVVPRTDPAVPATVYAGVTYFVSMPYDQYVWGDVFRSTDGGSSWAPLFPDWSGDPFAFPAWPSAPILAGARPIPTTPPAAQTSGSYEYDLCWLSKESGTIGGCVLGQSFVGASALAVDPQTQGIAYVGTIGSGVYKTTNSGATWSGGGTGMVTSLAVDRHTPAIVYAGTDDLGVLKSTDGGTTWTPASTGLTSYLEAQGLHRGIKVLAVDPLVPTTVYAGTAAGVFKSTDGGGTWTLTGLTQQSPLISLSVSPAAVTRGDESTGTVTLNSVAPAGGTVVMLSSTETAVANVPANVTVAATATSASFAISTSQGLSSPATVKISATLDDAARSASLTVAPPLGFMVLNTSRVAGGIAATGTVGLGLPAPAGGAAVSLSTSDPAVAAVPATVTVAAGATSANFTISTSTVTAFAPVTISAAYRGDSRSTILEVLPTTLSSLSLNPRGVLAGSSSTGTVTLSVPAPPGGAVVALSSSMTWVVTVPASVTVAAGAMSANFAISTNPVLPPHWGAAFVRITAAYGGDAVSSIELMVMRPDFALSSLSLDPATVIGGTAAGGTAILSAAATPGDRTIALSSSNPAVASVPPSVTVGVGATRTDFPVSTSAVTTPTIVTITAVHAGETRSAVVNVLPAILFSSLSLNLASVAAGSMSTGTVTLGAPAAEGGALVTLSSSNTAVATVPPSVTVAAGATSANFSVSTLACTSGSATLSGAYGGASRSAGLTVTSNPDNVTVQLADYYAGKDELRVSARSTGSAATLKVHVTSSGALIGTMRNLGDGKYSGQFTRSVNPQSITVRSSLCGSATTVVRKRG